MMDELLWANKANGVAYLATAPATALLPLSSFCKDAMHMAANMDGCFTHSAFGYSSRSSDAFIMPKRKVGAVPSGMMVQTLWVVSKIDIV